MTRWSLSRKYIGIPSLKGRKEKYLKNALLNCTQTNDTQTWPWLVKYKSVNISDSILIALRNTSKISSSRYYYSLWHQSRTRIVKFKAEVLVESEWISIINNGNISLVLLTWKVKFELVSSSLRTMNLAKDLRWGPTEHLCPRFGVSVSVCHQLYELSHNMKAKHFGYFTFGATVLRIYFISVRFHKNLLDINISCGIFLLNLSLSSSSSYLRVMRFVIVNLSTLPLRKRIMKRYSRAFAGHSLRINCSNTRLC